ncbi:MAG TPA: TIGR03560 family F420-dependent LLM class oxidoreductase [Acidimicrobiia bacterium]|jgi:F420-dependent oxidoreductase-like protein|nr:TIGR03560 family F420-dependent LLM class oxidoreductase [Acidimicrobiia bacterium]
MSPKFSFKVAPVDISWQQMSSIWTDADEAGFFDAGWLFDHFYPPRGPIRPMWEAWTLLASLAATTRRLRLGVMVSSNTFRHPALLAHMAASVDNVAAGRLEIGLGAGWHQAEHAAFGIELGTASQRWGRLAEALEIIDGLLTQDGYTFTGEHFQLTDARLMMKPVQQPRPPLVIGGIGPKRTMPLVARWADHWNYFNPGEAPEELRTHHDRLRQLCAAIGRDPAEIEVSVQIRRPESAEELTDLAGRYLAAGADHILVTSFPPVDADTVPGIAEALRPLR